MNDRLPAHLEAAAFRRLAEAEGGTAMVLAKGDADRGSILLMLLERGRYFALFERQLGLTGTYSWHAVGPSTGAAPAEISDFCAKRRRSDPDLWLIELDVPQAERFIVNSAIKS